MCSLPPIADGDGGGGSDNNETVEVITNPRQAGDICTIMEVCEYGGVVV
jgi:hypothetical protein